MNREYRLREALRANLQRRKVKARTLRERAQGKSDPLSDETGEYEAGPGRDAASKPVDD
ncbi:MAG: hypothetical protein AAFO68_04730 [Pseudomonadota bacterium]